MKIQLASRSILDPAVCLVATRSSNLNEVHSRKWAKNRKEMSRNNFEQGIKPVSEQNITEQYITTHSKLLLSKNSWLVSEKIVQPLSTSYWKNITFSSNINSMRRTELKLVTKIHESTVQIFRLQTRGQQTFESFSKPLDLLGIKPTVIHSVPTSTRWLVSKNFYRTFLGTIWTELKGWKVPHSPDRLPNPRV